ncbi:cation/H(+) antiporter 15 [Senna tora]|uniref:Cation/H(+) antiporter 15 n=1 Tax=Senna tora TaxID=362788 RepID=A0A834XE80_9FABA|nr:cation/H(+) antiporter 15 [Senna tora]
MGGNYTEASLVSGMNATDDAIVCYFPTSKITTSSVLFEDNPLDYSLPLFVFQLTLVVGVTRLFVFILKPFRQPRAIAEILGGLLLGPSGLGQNDTFALKVFPLRSMLVLEGLANIGLIYILFLVGLEMDISAIKHIGRKALFIAIAGMLLPFGVSATFSSIFRNHAPEMSQAVYILFLGIALSVTAFPVLARIIAELKLFNTDLGRLALSTALVNDVCTWIFLILAIALAGSNNSNSSLASIWVVLSSIAFVALCYYVVRPAIEWFLRDALDGESFSDLQITMVLTGVMISSFITDAIGAHAIFGAYVYGLCIPSGPIRLALIERLEDFVSGLLLPLFCANSGLRTNITVIHGLTKWAGCLVVIPLACAGKVLGTLLISLFFQIPARDGITLGLLMNTKGLIEIIVLNVAKDLKVMGDESFAMMVVIIVVMTALVAPIVTATYKPTRRFIPYKKRTIQGIRLNAERKLLVCLHHPSNVPTIINLLEASNPTPTSPLCVYALHLVELTGRVSAMLIVHNHRKSDHHHHSHHRRICSAGDAANGAQAQSDNIIGSFANFETNYGVDSVSVHPLTAVSPYSTMHQDICALAEDKRACFIIVPFHKQMTVDGGMENTNPAFQIVNQKLLLHSPCSIGILVDRGLHVSSRVSSTNLGILSSLNVAVLFFGGPHDREALAYARRMADRAGISITVTRFIPGEDATMEASQLQDDEHGENNNEDELNIYSEKEKARNEEYIRDFRKKTSGFESVIFVEKVVNNGEETIGAIGGMRNGFDLFIVGRDQGVVSPLIDGITDWSECPELGAIGDFLASTDFGTTASVLVIQQCAGEGGEDMMRVDGGGGGDGVESESNNNNKITMNNSGRHTLSSSAN